MPSDCRLCVCIQSIVDTDLVREIVEKKELTVEKLLVGMRDSMVMGWTLREMAGADGTLCDEHAAQVKDLQSPEEGETP